MKVRFANSYIDRLFAERDLNGLHHLISVLSAQRSLPEEFWLFCRVYEWAPARSGVWQYYEGLPDDKFERVSQGLDRFGLREIAEQYRLGKLTWKDEDRIAAVDEWLDSHAEEIHRAVFELIAARKDCLRDEA